MATKMQERMEFAANLARLAPELGVGAVVQLAQKLIRAGAKHTRACEYECNHQSTDASARMKALAHRTASNIVRELISYGAPASLHVVTQGDPRGYTVKLEWTLPGTRGQRELGVA